MGLLCYYIYMVLSMVQRFRSQIFLIRLVLL